MADKPARRRPRAARFETLHTLRDAVRARCERDYLKITGRDWQDGWGKRFRAPEGKRKVARNQLDVRADEVFQALRDAMKRALDFVAEVTVEAQETDDMPTRERIAAMHAAMTTAPHAGFLVTWVPRFVAPLMKHSALETAFRPTLEHDPRALLAFEYSSKDLLGLRRVPTDREAAIVSLLVGNFPDGVTTAHTVADVIARERRAMHLALDRNAHPATGRRRGP